MMIVIPIVTGLVRFYSNSNIKSPICHRKFQVKKFTKWEICCFSAICFFLFVNLFGFFLVAGLLFSLFCFAIFYFCLVFLFFVSFSVRFHVIIREIMDMV